jgi:hypothetical protein
MSIMWVLSHNTLTNILRETPNKLAIQEKIVAIIGMIGCCLICLSLKLASYPKVRWPNQATKVR